MKEKMMRLSHFNPFLVWYILGFIILGTADVLIGDFTMILLFFGMMFVINTLYFNLKYKMYMELTNSTQQVLKDNFELMTFIGLYVFLISYFINFNGIIYLMCITLIGYVSMFDLLITKNKDNKFTHLLIDVLLCYMLIYTFSYSYIELKCLLLIIITIKIVNSRQKTKYNVNKREFIFALGLLGAIAIYEYAFGFNLNNYTMMYGLRRGFAPDLIQFIFTFSVLFININIFDFLWRIKLKEYCNSFDGFFLKIIFWILLIMCINVLFIYSVARALLLISLTLVVYIMCRKKEKNVWL